MQYRTLGRTGLKVSAISLGTEYLLDAPPDLARRVIHDALDRGVNYFDLFWAYPAFRDTMGAAFAGRRHEALLAGHLGATVRDGQGDKTRDPSVAESFLLDFLTRYRTDYVDLLYLHNCDPQDDYDQLMAEEGLLGVARRLKEQGKARFLAFSGHTVSTARQAVESGVVDVLMFPINLAGHAVPGKRELLQTCAALGVGVVAMKPYAGGKLLQADHVLSMLHWHLGGPEREVRKAATITPLQCLSYVLSQPGISTIVPGCKNVQEVAQAQAYWEADAEALDYAAALAGFQEYVPGDCTYCNHCLPCPAEINIGATMRLLDQARIGMTPALRAAYGAQNPNAGDCLQCGSCEERCPFGVAVVERMAEGAERFQ